MKKVKKISKKALYKAYCDFSQQLCDYDKDINFLLGKCERIAKDEGRPVSAVLLDFDPIPDPELKVYCNDYIDSFAERLYEDAVAKGDETATLDTALAITMALNPKIAELSAYEAYHSDFVQRAAKETGAMVGTALLSEDKMQDIIDIVLTKCQRYNDPEVA